MRLEIRRLLCAVDQSDYSAYALLWASVLARAFSARLYVVHAAAVQPPLEFTHDQVDQVVEELEEAVKDAGDVIGGWAAELIPPGVEWETVVSRRQPVEAILAEADRLDADLIVLGTHGRGGFARWFLGSIAEGVMEDTTRPCLVVHHTDQPLTRDSLPEPRRLLCPVNYTRLARECLTASSALARRLGAELLILHTVEELDPRPIEHHQDALCEWVPQEVRANCELSEVVRRGRPAEQIVTYARYKGVDLIVMGAQRKLLADVPVMGTTAERVIRLAPCPVLAVPRQAEEAKE